MQPAGFSRRLSAARPAALALLVLGACDEPPEPAQPPQGAVVGVGSTWILEEEVDRWIDTIALLEPTETRPSWRRKALTNVVIPIKLAQLLVPAERELARQRALEVRKVLQTQDTLPADWPETIESKTGRAFDVGLQHWLTAHELPLGQWSDIQEEPGAFLILRVLSAPPAEDWVANTPVEIEFVQIHYIRTEDDPKLLVEQMRERTHIWAVDPEWEWILPQYYQ